MIRTFVQDHQKTKKLLAVRSFKPDLLLLNKKIRLRFDEVFFRHQCVPLWLQMLSAWKKPHHILTLLLRLNVHTTTYISYYHLYLMRLMLLPQIFNITFFGIDIVHGPPPTNLGFPMIPGWWWVWWWRCCCRGRSTSSRRRRIQRSRCWGHFLSNLWPLGHVDCLILILSILKYK